VRPKSCTALPRILRENGYVTGGFGKWHLTPDNVQGPAGPFDHWPQAWGFDHWWGFLSGAAGQYDPIITQDDSTLGVPEGKDGQQYYFPDDLTGKAVEWLHRVRRPGLGGRSDLKRPAPPARLAAHCGPPPRWCSLTTCRAGWNSPRITPSPTRSG